MVPVAGGCGGSDPSDRVALLSGVYEECVVARGFDPGFVQVVLFPDSDTPLGVKTGNSVPNAIHVPCFEAIGGTPALPG
jgi:hypothetical protein